MSQTTAACAICYRSLVDETLNGKPSRQEIQTNEISDWADQYAPVMHEHVWYGVSIFSRRNWFGSEMFGCGAGVGILPYLCAQRNQFTESEMKLLIGTYYKLVKQYRSKETDLSELVKDFSARLHEDPSGLIDSLAANQ